MTRTAAVEIRAVPGLPMIAQGDDLAALIAGGLARGGLTPHKNDVIVIAQKIVSKAEGRSVDLATVVPSARAIALADEVKKDPRLVELILSESVRVVRSRPNVLIVEHRLGFVMANAGVDQSNVAPTDGIERALLLPLDPDRTAETLRARLSAQFGATLAVIITDSFGRARRRGAARHGGRGDWRGRPAGAPRPARQSRPVRPHPAGQHHRLRRRDRRRSVAGDGARRRGAASRAGAWPQLECPRQSRLRTRAAGGRGHVPVNNGLVVALSGGVGGAKLALGLSRVLPADELLIVANTGDDFEHLGLSICPDIDTLTYVLAGLDNPVTGWGRRDETWSFMETITALGGEDWFRLGDRDLALHVERTHRLAAGQTLSQITAEVCRRLGIGPRVLPMSDDRVRTRVRSESGWIDFQDYFVRQQCRPVVQELAFTGAADARPQSEVVAALSGGNVRAVVFCPSNPFISIEPILAVPGMRAAIENCGAPVVAVSPIVGGRAVKGPTAKMMQELGLAVSSATVAGRYGALLDGYIVDAADSGDVRTRQRVAPTLMTTLEDREALARTVLDFAGSLT
jgi:LPPG:FO 2-phospho-L-lactate transferase